MGFAGSTRQKLRARLHVEQLEDRRLLSGFQPTSVEQLFLEQLNDARANPAAYGAAIGFDLSNVAPEPPLAFNPALIQAARLHSDDMNDRAYFDHNTPNGVNPGVRLTQAGFFWNGWGESIAGGSAYPGPADALSALIVDDGVPNLGHRNQLLAITQAFQSQTQVGIGVLQFGNGPLTNYYTIDTASSPASGPFLTGVVFNDSNGDGRYAPPEGLAGVSITIVGVGTTTTFDSGGYTLAVAPGTYIVTSAGPGLPAPLARTVTIGVQNVRLNFAVANPSTIQKDYQAILGRAASTAEIASWMSTLNTAGGAAIVASRIENSPEARTRLVRSWYATYLGRQPGNGEEQGWVNALLRGVPEEQLQAAFLGSGEFYDRAAAQVSPGTNDQRFLQALYVDVLGRRPQASEVAGWSLPLSNLGRAGVALAFLGSTEYREDEVRVYYASLLKRPASPTAAEVDAWALSTLSLQDIRLGFESSREYVQFGA